MANSGFDHGIGHPLLLLYNPKAPNCRQNKAFKSLGHYAESPKVADAVIKAQTPFFEGYAIIPPVCNVTTEVAVLLTLYVALAATHSDSAWQILRRQHCRK
jgi:hypothetical protein